MAQMPISRPPLPLTRFPVRSRNRTVRSLPDGRRSGRARLPPSPSRLPNHKQRPRYKRSHRPLLIHLRRHFKRRPHRLRHPNHSPFTGRHYLGQCLRVQSPRLIRSRQNNLLRQRKQCVSHLIHRLIPHRPKNNPHWLSAKKFPDVPGQRPRPGRIVRAIQNQIRRPRNPLQPARPPHRRDPCPNQQPPARPSASAPQPRSAAFST